MRILMFIVLLLISCTPNNVDTANKSMIKEVHSTGFYNLKGEILCSELDVDVMLDNWQDYQCDLYSLFDEECYENQRIPQNEFKVRLFIDYPLKNNYIYSYSQRESCTVHKLKEIPMYMFNLFRYLHEDSNIEFSTKRKIVTDISVTDLIKEIKQNFSSDPILDNNPEVVYIIEILDSNYSIYFAKNNLSEAQERVIQKFK